MQKTNKLSDAAIKEIVEAIRKDEDTLLRLKAWQKISEEATEKLDKTLKKHGFKNGVDYLSCFDADKKIKKLVEKYEKIISK